MAATSTIDPGLGWYHWLRAGATESFSLADREWHARFAAALAFKPDDPKTAAAWDKAGFETLHENGLLGLREIESDRRGRGAFVLREQPRVPVLLQAPHADTDVGTGLLSARLFLELPFAALAVNTARRDSAEGADQAHSPDASFVTMARTILHDAPDLRVVQLHGYAEDKAQRAKLPANGVIVSAGRKRASELSRNVTQCLIGSGFVALLYGQDVQVLGGTTNHVGRALHEDGHRDRFLHLELGPELRRRLLDDIALRRRFGACL